MSRWGLELPKRLLRSGWGARHCVVRRGSATGDGKGVKQGEEAGVKNAERAEESVKEQSEGGGVKTGADTAGAEAGREKTAEDRWAGLSERDRYLLDPTSDPLYKQKAWAKAGGAFVVFLIVMGGLNLYEKQLIAEREESKKKKEEPKFSIFAPARPQAGAEPGAPPAMGPMAVLPHGGPRTMPGASALPDTSEGDKNVPDPSASQPLLTALRNIEEQQAAAGEDGPQTVQKVFTTVGSSEEEETLSELEELQLEELELLGRLKRLRAEAKSRENDAEKKQIKTRLAEVGEALKTIQ